MLRISNLKMRPGFTENDLRAAVARKLKLDPRDVLSCRLYKRSVDARDKGDVHFVVTADIKVPDEKAVLQKAPKGACTPVRHPAAPVRPHVKSAPVLSPVVVGLGPCGLFAALTLARAGCRPIVLERGEPVENRARTVETFFADGTLNTDSNIQFGEGGAGAFSDGKLTTGIKDVRCREVLETLVQFGAPEAILYEGKPHIGTDKLPATVSAIRREIERLGGQVHFNAKLCAIQVEKHAVRGISYLQHGQKFDIPCEKLLIAIGHSADDTQKMLFEAGLDYVQKPFSVGARIEHPQSLINQSQYGKFAHNPHLPAAEYHLSTHLSDGRGAYTFCMCPGGQVVGAASRKNAVCTNGMSPYARDGENANAALLIDVRTEDFPDSHPLSGYALQKVWEEKAFRAGGENYHAPIQRVEDFLQGKDSKHTGSLLRPTYRPGVTPGNLRQVLPDFAWRNMAEAIRIFDRQLKGFAHPDALLTGVEARSSCPVRAPRDQFGEGSIHGVYPCGEGAGYAGGIMSAAVDGIRGAEYILRDLTGEEI